MVDFELLEFVQARFYNPSVFNSYIKENNIDADIAQNHIYDLQKKFETVLKDPSVRRSFLYSQSNEDIFERSRIFGILLETTSGLQSVQFVDSNGLRLHYSTSPRDIISQNINSTAYRNYNEDVLALSYDTVNVLAGSDAKFTMDEKTDRIIFSFPFNDSMDVYRGTALFNVSVRALAEKFIEEGRLKINEDVSLIGNPPGIVLGIPSSSKSDILKKISAIWNSDLPVAVLSSVLTANTEQNRSAHTLFNRVTIDAADSGVKYSLISLKTDRGLFFGRLTNEYLFTISNSMKLILQLSIFLTIFLTLFFIFNLKPNAITLVRNRIKHLRENLFEQLYVNKTSHERAKWILELEQRREEIRTALKRNLILGKHQRKNIDSIIDKSWDELLTVIKSGSGTEQKTESKESIVELEEVEVLDEAEALEEIDEAEELEEVEALEEIDEAEELEVIEELEEIDEVEELEEVEVLEEIGEAEELEVLEELDEVEEIEEAQELEVLEELEEVKENAGAEINRIEVNDDIDFIEEIDDSEEEIEINYVIEAPSFADLEMGAFDEIEEYFELDEIEKEAEFSNIEVLDEIKETEVIEDITEKEETALISLDGLDEIFDRADAEVYARKSIFGSSEGLLKKAEKKSKQKRKGLLEAANNVFKKNKRKRKGKGLLALAAEIEPEKSKSGLLATADKIKLSKENISDEIDIVSPFSSMFSNLKDE
ncbi:MAG: hypothetical protein FWB86_06505 [Treponema sp.]|nr:hypothetical protein [Treponema sp.]MCL2250877.1 hypothetical protein [Treponema sp.]